MTSYEEFRKELLNDPDVAAEYEALEPEFDIIRSLMEARIQSEYDTKRIIRENWDYAGGYQPN